MGQQRETNLSSLANNFKSDEECIVIWFWEFWELVKLKELFKCFSTHECMQTDAFQYQIFIKFLINTMKHTKEKYAAYELVSRFDRKFLCRFK